MNRISTLLLTFALVFIIFTKANAEDIPDAVLKNSQGVYYIVTESTSSISSGTAFVISSNEDGTYLITNYHVVKENIKGVSVWISKREKTHATVVSYNEQYDLALIKLSQTIETKVLSFSLNAKQGDSVYAVGFPAAAKLLSDSTPVTNDEATITNGVISSIRRLKLVNYGSDVKILQINADINSGNSGGPLFNSNGDVIGINTFLVTNSAGIYGAIDSSVINDFVKTYGLSIKIIEPTTQILSLYWVFIIIGFALFGLIALIIVFIIKNNQKKDNTSDGNYSQLRFDDYLLKIDYALSEQDVVALMLPLAMELAKKHDQGSLFLRLSPKYLLVTKIGILINQTEKEDGFVQYKYLAPEQISNRPVSVATDIYSFCMVLKTLASNKLSSGVNFEYPIPEVGTNLKNGQLIDTRRKIGANPQTLVLKSIIEKGLQEKPKDRFNSFQELIFSMAELNNGLSDDAIKPLRTNTPKYKKMKLVFALISILIVFMVTVFLYQKISFDKINNYISAHEFEKANTVISHVIAPKEFIPNQINYVNAGLLLNSKQYDKAFTAFTNLGNFADSTNMALESKYRKAAGLADSEEFETAIMIYSEISGYKDSANLVNDTLFRKGNFLLNQGEFEKALVVFVNLEKDKYNQAEEMINEAYYDWGSSLIKDKDYYQAFSKFKLTKGYKDTDSILSNLTYILYVDGQELYHNDKYSEAAKYFTAIGDYLRSKDYQYLIKLHLNQVSSPDDQHIANLIYFEDMAKLVVKNNAFAQAFLQGYWSGNGGYFKMANDGTTTYSLPENVSGDYYEIENGIYYLFYRGHQSQRKAVFKFEVFSEDLMSVFTYSNSGTYLLSRR